jgi:hypothetical protein
MWFAVVVTCAHDGLALRARKRNNIVAGLADCESTDGILADLFVHLPLQTSPSASSTKLVQVK